MADEERQLLRALAAGPMVAEIEFRQADQAVESLAESGCVAVEVDVPSAGRLALIG